MTVFTSLILAHLFHLRRTTGQLPFRRLNSKKFKSDIQISSISLRSRLWKMSITDYYSLGRLAHIVLARLQIIDCSARWPRTSSSSFLSGFLREFHPRSHGGDRRGREKGRAGGGTGVQARQLMSCGRYQGRRPPHCFSTMSPLSAARLLRVPVYRGISERQPSAQSRYFNHPPFYVRNTPISRPLSGILPRLQTALAITIVNSV